MTWIQEQDLYTRSGVMRYFDAKFPGLRPRVTLIRDQFGQAIDYDLPGRYGVAYEYDSATMAFACYSKIVTTRVLREFPQVKLFAGGGEESVLHVPNDVFPAFARRIGLKRRRELSPQQREALRKAGEKTQKALVGRSSGAATRRNSAG